MDIVQAQRPKIFPWLSQPHGYALCRAGFAIRWLLVPSPGADEPGREGLGSTGWEKPGQQGGKLCLALW